MCSSPRAVFAAPRVHRQSFVLQWFRGHCSGTLFVREVIEKDKETFLLLALRPNRISGEERRVN
jgi:hypothetical protein